MSIGHLEQFEHVETEGTILCYLCCLLFIQSPLNLLCSETSLECTVFFSKGDNLSVKLQRTDSRKDAKIAKKRMEENGEGWDYPDR